MKIIRDSIKHVIQSAKHVSFNEAKLLEFCQSFQPIESSLLADAPHPSVNLSLQQKANLELFKGAVNFSFWENPKWEVEYQDKFYNGSYGLLASFYRALELEMPIFDARYAKDLSSQELEIIFKGSNKIPLFEERLANIREMGEVMEKRYNGSLELLLEQIGYNATSLVERLASDFPSFNDFSYYQQKKVLFHKRAQLVASGLADIYENTSNPISGIDQLTALADYKIPQFLRHKEILVYTPSLAQRIDALQPLKSGSEEEVKIRAFTIHTVARIKEMLLPRFPSMTELDIDNDIWLVCQQPSLNMKPYHRTKTIFY